MTSFRFLLVLPSIVYLFAGCATQPSGQDIVTDGMAALNAASLCCESLNTAKSEPLPLQKTIFQIDSKSQVFNFGGNKAFFKLFELPAYEKPYSVVVSSQSKGAQLSLALFIPRIAIYNAQFEVVRYFDESTLRSRANNLERTVFINPSNSSERYFAIYSSDLSATIERSYSQVTASTINTGTGVFWNVYSGNDGKIKIQSSPVGSIELDISGLSTPSK